MIAIPPKAFLRRRKGAPVAPPVPAALVLQTASFNNSDGVRVFLTFDREIDFTHVDVGAFVVCDGVGGIRWTGAAVYGLGPSGVQVILENTGAYAGSGRSLDASAANGIVAVDDGGTWEGCAGLALPYPYVPPAALLLVGATYDAGAGNFTLTFDRAIDVSAMAPSQINLGDASSAVLYVGDGTPTLIAANQVQVGLSSIGDFGGDATVLDATGETGIVAVDDGGTWEGCTWLGLPFP